VPVLTPANTGQCFFRILPLGLGDTVQIFYLGLLGKGQNIRHTISGLQPAVAGHTIQPFDSDTVLAGTPPSPTLARKPARLVVVLDKSGSMDWTTKPADMVGCGSYFTPLPQCRRWNVLTSAAAQFVNVAKAYAIPGDQLGVVFFDTTATNTGGIAAMTSVTLNAVNSAISMKNPGGNTSLGAGVTNLDLHTNNATLNNITLVFTDGEQNTAPYLVSDGTQLLINPTMNQPFGTPWLQAGDKGGL
jgi:von Willebrand factor type A domain